MLGRSCVFASVVDPGHITRAASSPVCPPPGRRHPPVVAGLSWTDLCGDPTNDQGLSLIGCYFGDMQPGDVVQVVLTFQPTTVQNFTDIIGLLSFADGASDTNVTNNEAATWINTVRACVRGVR